MRRQRLRIQFTKTGALKYISHLDLMRLWERALRRAGLPLVFSQGFNPQPKIIIAAALPIGISGRAEVMDVFLETPMPTLEVAKMLPSCLPDEVRLVSIEEVPWDEPSLQVRMRTAEYEARVPAEWTLSELRKRVATFLAASEIWHERRSKGKTKRYDLRSLVEDVRVIGREGEHFRLSLRLKHEPGATGRPDDVLAALGVMKPGVEIERVRLEWDIENAGSKFPDG
ncbi:MAG: DUF2344 domain-containing protein [Chloroflexi bacterium]|nr:DUF2344 domain-containing protein [Chloroflexota bacterium]